MTYRTEDDYNAAQIAANGPAPSIAEQIDEATGGRYPARALWRMEEERLIGGGESERIINECWSGWFSYALEIESTLRDTDEQLRVARKELQAAQLALALKNIGRAA